MLTTVDHVVAIPPYTLQSDLDEYRWFAIPTNFPDTVYVNAIEVLPGIDDVVHHVDISFDMTGNTMANDMQDPLPGFNGSTGQPTYTFYMNAWQPGVTSCAIRRIGALRCRPVLTSCWRSITDPTTKARWTAPC